MNDEGFKEVGWVYIHEQLPPLNTVVTLGRIEWGVFHSFKTIISRPFKDECPSLDVLYYEKDGCHHQLTTDLMWKPEIPPNAIKELLEWVLGKINKFL